MEGWRPPNPSSRAATTGGGCLRRPPFLTWPRGVHAVGASGVVTNGRSGRSTSAIVATSTTTAGGTRTIGIERLHGSKAVVVPTNGGQQCAARSRRERGIERQQV